MRPHVFYATVQLIPWKILKAMFGSSDETGILKKKKKKTCILSIFYQTGKTQCIIWMGKRIWDFFSVDSSTIGMRSTKQHGLEKWTASLKPSCLYSLSQVCSSHCLKRASMVLTIMHKVTQLQLWKLWCMLTCVCFNTIKKILFSKKEIVPFFLI